MTPVQVKIGLVPSYRNRYTAWGQKMLDDSLAALAGVAGIEVVAPRVSSSETVIDAERGATPHGMVHTLDEAEAVAAYFQRQGVQGLIIVPLDFGDERSAAKIAERLRVPVLLCATKEPPALDDPGLTRVSDSYCGTLSIASALYRRKLPFRFAGVLFPDEPAFAAEAQDFARAVAVVAGIKGARLGQVGVRAHTFETVAYDEVALVRAFQQNVLVANVADMVLNAQGYADDDPRVQGIIADIRGSTATVTVGETYLLKAAKLELALAEFYRNNRLSAMAMQCWSTVQRMWGISVCNIYGRLTGQGLLTACETDVLGALAMLVNHRAALGATLPHFVDWTIRHRENPNWLLAWHCGNAPACLASDPGQTALRSRKDMAGELPVPACEEQAGLAQFQLKPGPVTFCRLAEYDDQWKMLIARGEIIPSDDKLAGTWSWVQVRDHERLYRTLVEEGFIHHASMIHGDQAKALELACQFLNIKPVVVE